MTFFALDIGGAFIKFAVLSPGKKPRRGIVPFELWKNPGRLASVLKTLRPPKPFSAAITMTGELCDCFKNRAEGVRRIVAAARRAFGEVTVFGVSGELLPAGVAVARHSAAASANWAIVPRWLARTVDDFLLVDIGSTTTDLTPVRRGKISNKGFADFERLRHGELLYTGYLRTAVAAVTPCVPLRGALVPLSAETFAVMGDVHLVLGNMTPAKYFSGAPDGGPKTVAAARRRLARCVLADEGELSMREVTALARQVAAAQLAQITSAAKKFKLPAAVVGGGAFILKPAFKSGALQRHPLMRGPGTATLDPSLALALAMRNRVFVP